MSADTVSERVLLDKQTPEVYRAQVAVAKALRTAVEGAGLDRRLAELVNIRISQINGCAYCLDVHVREALRNEETQQRLAVLPAWRDAGIFTDQERAALNVAETVTTLPAAEEQDRRYAEAREHLSDDQFSAIAWLAVAMNAFNRISITSRHPVRPRPVDRQDD